jgi:hypothetical protein
MLGIGSLGRGSERVERHGLLVQKCRRRIQVLSLLRLAPFLKPKLPQFEWHGRKIATTLASGCKIPIREKFMSERSIRPVVALGMMACRRADYFAQVEDALRRAALI